MNESEIGRSTTYNHDIGEKYKRDGEGNGRKVVQSAEIAKDRRFREGCRGDRVDGKVSWFDLCAGNETSGQWRNAAEPLLETRYMHGAPRRYKGTTTPASTLRSSVSPSLWPPLHNYSVEATTSPPLDRTIPVHPSSYTTPLNPLQLCLIWFYLLTRNFLPYARDTCSASTNHFLLPSICLFKFLEWRFSVALIRLISTIKFLLPTLIEIL